jgi:MFS superfamily sulfate permease-like transporter
MLDHVALWQTSKSDVFIYATTLLVVVCQDLLIGIVVGIILSAEVAV